MLSTCMVRTILSYVCHQILTYNATKWLIWCILTLRTLMIHMMYEDSLNRQSDISNPHLALYSYWWWLSYKRNGSILDNHFYYFSSSLWSMYNPKTYVDNNSESAYEEKRCYAKSFLSSKPSSNLDTRPLLYPFSYWKLCSIVVAGFTAQRILDNLFSRLRLHCLIPYYKDKTFVDAFQLDGW